MKFVFYAFSKRINSTKIPGNGREVEGNIFEPCEILAPVLIISPNNYNITYNYVQIPEFERYYFIKSWEFSGGRYYAKCMVDVLASHKTQIGETTQYVLRSASNYNGYLIDTAYPVTSNFSDENIIVNDIFTSDYNSGKIVVGIVGGASTVNGVTYYVMSPSEFGTLRKKIMAALPTQEGVELEISDTLGTMLYNPYQYIVSAMWFPFSKIPASGSSNIFCGFFDTQISAPVLGKTHETHTIGTYEIPDHPQIARGEYLNSSDYRKIILHYPPFADLELRAFPGITAITATITVDYISGQSILNEITTGETDVTYSRASASLGVPMLLAQVTTSVNSVQTMAVSAVSQISKNPVGSVLNWLKPAAKFLDTKIFGLTENEFDDSFNELFSGVIGDTSGVNNPALMYNVNTSGMSGSTLYTTAHSGIEVIYSLLADEDNARIGRPLYKPVKLNTLSGFFKCATDAFQISGANYSELMLISGYLTNGMYWE